jgi:hypothetical protein
MKLIVCTLFAALALAAADITIVVRTDAGAVVSTTVLNTTNAVLTALNEWRLAQGIKYPTVDSFWRGVIGDFFRERVLMDYNAAILEQRRLIDVANAEIDRLKALALQ